MLLTCDCCGRLISPHETNTDAQHLICAVVLSAQLPPMFDLQHDDSYGGFRNASFCSDEWHCSINCRISCFPSSRANNPVQMRFVLLHTKSHTLQNQHYRKYEFTIVSVVTRQISNPSLSAFVKCPRYDENRVSRTFFFSLF